MQNRLLTAVVIGGLAAFGAAGGCGGDSGGGAENTLAACGDDVDNDGDGYTDCDDQDCLIFSMCTGADADGDGDGDADADADTDAEADALPVVAALRVAPRESLVELDLGGATTIDYTVTAVYDDGSERDATDEVSWSVSNAAVGSMTGATLGIGGFAARFFGSAIVTAELEGVDGTAQVTVAAYRRTGADAEAVLVLPFEDPAGAESVELEFGTATTAMDVFFNIDTTGSMDGVITNLQTALNTTVLPGIRAVVTDTQFGVGAYEDFPVAPFGESSCTYGALGGPDQPFELFQEVTGDTAAVQTALNGLALSGNAIGCGNDTPESAIEALYQIATGEGLAGPAPTFVPAGVSGIGGVAFRAGTLPVIVNVTDAVSHDADASACPGVTYTGSVLAAAHGLSATMAAVRGICGRVVQISSSTAASCSSVSDGAAWNVATGAVVPPEAWDVGTRPAGCAPGQCCTGLSLAGVAPQGGVCPLTYFISSAGAGGDVAITSAVEMAARFAPMTVGGAAVGVGQDEAGVALPGGTTTADFVRSLTPGSHGASPIPGLVPTVTATEFQQVIPGTDVVLTVEVFNDFVVQGAELRLFVATVQALADGCRVLGQRPLYIVVPPAPLS